MKTPIVAAAAVLLLAGCGAPRHDYANDVAHIDHFTCHLQGATLTWDATLTNYRDHRARLTVYVAPVNHEAVATTDPDILMSSGRDLNPDESGPVGGRGDYTNLTGGVAGCRVVNVVAVALEDSEL